MTFFNEFDPFAAQWLRNLYPDATVAEKDIRDVRSEDVAGFRRCHFFGGIGGWQYALELAGWPIDREVWSGSCPCQPYSTAGKGKANEDDRNLWPAMFRLIRECRPQCVFGEQVANAISHGWLDGISADLEGEGYAVGSVVFGAHSVGAPHIRQRLYWVAESTAERHGATSVGGGDRKGEVAWGLVEPGRFGAASRLAITDGQRAGVDAEVLQAGQSEPCSIGGRVVDANGTGPFAGSGAAAGNGYGSTTVSAGSGLSDAGGEGLARSCTESTWEERKAVERSSRIAICRDGRFRRISAEPGDEPLAHGIPRDLGQRFPELRPLAKGARANRVGRLRGYGNAIVPQVAATFIRAFMEATNDNAA